MSALTASRPRDRDPRAARPRPRPPARPARAAPSCSGTAPGEASARSTSPSPVRCSSAPAGRSCSSNSRGSSRDARSRASPDARRRLGAHRRGAPHRSGRLPRPLVVGGRSAGARVACRTAGPLEADAGCCSASRSTCPGHPDRLRAHELALAPDPSWVVQGTNDASAPRRGPPAPAHGHDLIEVPGASFPRGSRSALTEALTRIAGMLPG